MKDFTISTDKSSFQIDRIHRFLSRDAYWCEGIPLETLERAIQHSLCFGVFDSNKNIQVGFARVVTDYATFAWLCDVYIEKEYRGKGLSKWLVQNVLDHSELKGLRRICLATKDAHTLYLRFGFKVTETPQNWLEIKNNNIYKNL